MLVMRGFLLIALLVVTSCGQGKKSDGTAKMIQRGQLEDGVDPFVGEQTLACSSPDGQCPQAVGRLLTVFPDRSFSSCTGFLITPQIIMTNSHCIEEMSSEEYCAKTRFIVSTGKGMKAKAVRCSEVLQVNPLTEEETHNDNDYAFVKLAEPSDIKPLVVDAQAGVSENQPYSVWSIDSEDGGKAHVVRRDCEAIQRSLVLPHFEDQFSSIIALNNCAIIPGNSGSPILNSAGHAVAIAYAGNDQEVADVHPVLQGRRVALGVNFACVDFPGLAAFNGASCSRMDIRGAGRRIQAVMSEKLTEALSDKIAEWLKANDESLRQRFEWRPEGVRGDVWSPVPACAKGTGEFNTEIALPVWGIKSMADERLRPRPTLRKDSESQVRLFAWPGETETDPWVFSLEGDDELNAITAEIPVCSEN